MAAAGRRRSARTASQKAPESSGGSNGAPKSPAKAEEPAAAAAAAASEDENSCPACKDDGIPKAAASEKESWIRCDACTHWFHWRCAGDGTSDPETLDKWFCKPCMAANSSRVITVRPPARKSSRQKKTQDYANLNSGGDAGDAGRWLRMLQGKVVKADNLRRMQGSEVGLEWLESDENALKDPIVIEDPEGLGMKMTPSDFTVNDVAESVGNDVPVEVIDVATQSNSPGWTVGKWAEYYSGDRREKVLNVISLEISGTPLADQVLPPRLVRELDWVEKFWPPAKRGKGHVYPKVQLYCLMGVARAWTDWHVDFAGSSVYYHILRGSKIFYFIRPTPTNLAAYERWSGTELQNQAWLGDMVDEVVKVELKPGNTMIIPTGWIHAVYTPVDTLVFGGNFLHSYNMSTQLKICEIERTTHVPKKFRFPHFTKLCWYVGDKYLKDLKSKEEFSPRVLDSIEALANYLVSEARAIERGSDQAKKTAKENVPSDRVKDPAALARELRWRVRQSSGHISDDEGHARRKGKTPSPSEPATNGHKRKREDSDEGPESHTGLRHFRPKKWDVVKEDEAEASTSAVRAPRPGDGEAWADEWVGWREAWEGGDDAGVSRRRSTMTRVRRTEKGLERQRVERVVEQWTWAEGAQSAVPAASGTIPEVKAEGEGVANGVEGDAMDADP